MHDDFERQLGSDVDNLQKFLTQEIDEAAGVPDRLREAMRLAVLGGGKRLRPFLVMECAALFGVPRAAALPTAAALECLHCYSLVHDDLPAMDNDKLRRGQPTVWAAFDEWTAILAGDALLTLAFEIIARDICHPKASVRAELTLELARAAGPAGMVGGQCLDLQSDKLNLPAHPDAEYVRHMQSLKTGALLRFACEAGAIVAEAEAGDRANLRQYGTHIGIAFQIADDLLDIEGSPETVGKATGKDHEAGKATLVGLLGTETARSQLNDTTAAALATLQHYGEQAARLRAAANFVATRRR